ncbi:MAG TPA: ATP-binding protein [Syntrophales bacterium]|nr:ATP-binding protein [Syntrophales bacterium]HOX93791.1 ATP-binding protein [Syntrophales bacterium]HPI56137.1 ATP-binding protein [Syntrophales bacterium]HPN23973.1 ATP-binding protein [Syntrophales bacterium]HQM28252.1 ATP-binding protein [Syntrophales bacterium]
MKQIVVISGKGGTGKTVITASFAALAKNKVMVDCDVDAADLHLLLHPRIIERHEFRSGKTARIDLEKCVECGKCVDLCRFDAISPAFVVDKISCEGCGLCGRICPAGAVVMEENLSGEWFVSNTAYGPFVYARLGIAEENSGKLVAQVRQVAKEIAERDNLDYVLIDGPPGIGCPVIASLSDTDLALIITEPTLSGIHDMSRAAELTGHFRIKTAVVINKHDLNPWNTADIEKMCQDRDIEVIGEIPFSEEVSRSIVRARPLVEISSNAVGREISSIWRRIEVMVAENKKK